MTTYFFQVAFITRKLKVRVLLENSSMFKLIYLNGSLKE